MLTACLTASVVILGLLMAASIAVHIITWMMVDDLQKHWQGLNTSVQNARSDIIGSLEEVRDTLDGACNRITELGRLNLHQMGRIDELTAELEQQRQWARDYATGILYGRRDSEVKEPGLSNNEKERA